MSAFIKITGNRVRLYLKEESLAASAKHRVTRSNMGLEFYEATPQYAAGPDKGKDVEAELKPNQRVVWSLGLLEPTKYHVMVEVHPDLYRFGQVQFTRIAEPNERSPFVVRLTAAEQCEIRTLPWIARVYLLD